jgi:RNA recognition motif-containing protein
MSTNGDVMSLHNHYTNGAAITDDLSALQDSGTISAEDALKGPPNACLFVASLSPETTEETLKELFNQHGELLKIKLLKDRSSRPYAFVQYKVFFLLMFLNFESSCLISSI